MDGIHDLGGRQGFGQVEPDETMFHGDWERRVFGLALVGRQANVDAFRHAIERLDPVTYLTAGYFGRWLGALELLTREADEGVRATGPTALRPIDREPAFGVGARVRVRDLFTSGHTRMPGYVRGRCGTVVAVHPSFVYPDTNAHGLGEKPQHAYGVRFEGTELWGQTADAASAVHVDLFEDYLEAQT
jgi:hypothetical protein